VATDYGQSDFDVRDSLAGAVSYRFPAPVRGRFANALLRDWQMDGLVRTSTAPPYNPIALASSSVFGSYYARPNVVPVNPPTLSTQSSRVVGGSTLQLSRCLQVDNKGICPAIIFEHFPSIKPILR
jgi:hypothetical protein